MNTALKEITAALILAGALSSAAFAAYSQDGPDSQPRKIIDHLRGRRRRCRRRRRLQHLLRQPAAGSEDITRSVLSFQINAADVAFDPMPLPNLLLFQGLVQTIREPLVKFRSERIERLGAGSVRVTGMGETQRHRGQVSLKANFDGCRASRCRLYGFCRQAIFPA